MTLEQTSWNIESNQSLRSLRSSLRDGNHNFAANIDELFQAVAFNATIFETLPSTPGVSSVPGTRHLRTWEPHRAQLANNQWRRSRWCSHLHTWAMGPWGLVQLLGPRKLLQWWYWVLGVFRGPQHTRDTSREIECYNSAPQKLLLWFNIQTRFSCVVLSYLWLVTFNPKLYKLESARVSMIGIIHFQQR